MPLLIGDANIFIDFEVGGLIEEVFALPDTIGVPDLLFETELRERHEDLLDFGLLLMELTSEGIQRTAKLAAVYRKPSRLDLTALVLAEQHQCRLLTVDKELREAAEEEGIEVRGTLWVCERLVVERVIAVARPEKAFQKMKKGNSRLPWTAVETQIRYLRSRKK